MSKPSEEFKPRKLGLDEQKQSMGSCSLQQGSDLALPAASERASHITTCQQTCTPHLLSVSTALVRVYVTWATSRSG